MKRAIDESLRARLLKVLRLSEQGVGGEKKNAEVLLDKLLRKHGLTRDALNIDQQQRDTVWHPYGDTMELEIFGCIARCVCQRKVELFKPRGSKKTVVGLEATPSEHIAITVMCDVYFPKWKEAVFELAVAFAFRHQLTDNSDRDEQEDAEPAQIDGERALRLRALMDGLENVDRPQRRLGPGARA